MNDEVKRGRGRPRKEVSVTKTNVAKNIKPKQDDTLLFEINLKFLEAYGFQLTEAQAKAYLLQLVRSIEV
jgi:hypothetical protein